MFSRKMKIKITDPTAQLPNTDTDVEKWYESS